MDVTAPDAAPERGVVRAGGGIVWAPAAGPGATVLVALVHRPRYDDWTFPKGKCEPGEDERAAALREVEEETGLRCTAGAEVASTRYTDARGRPKRVVYFLMQVRADASVAFRPNDEVDELRWCAPGDASSLLSYDHDRALLEQVRSRLRPR